MHPLNLIKHFTVFYAHINFRLQFFLLVTKNLWNTVHWTLIYQKECHVFELKWSAPKKKLFPLNFKIFFLAKILILKSRVSRISPFLRFTHCWLNQTTCQNALVYFQMQQTPNKQNFGAECFVISQLINYNCKNCPVLNLTMPGLKTFANLTVGK